jgi:hypothetical protein
MRADQAHHHAHRNRVEADEWLVVDQMISGSITMARARATRRAIPPESSDGIICAGAAKANSMQLRQHDVTDQALRQPGVLAKWKGDVLVDVEIGQQRTVLEQHTHALSHLEQFAPAQLRDFLSVEQDAALVGQFLPRDQPEQCGLPGAAGTHDRGDAAAPDIDIQALEDHRLAERIGEVPNDDDVVVA